MPNMPPDTLPKLSVIMVVRNAASTIGEAIESLIAQHYPNLEFIVWDGLSTDGTQAVLAQYKHIITTFKSEQDKGAPDGCNKAVALATGDFIGFLYADDVYAPGMLWAVATAIIRNPDSDVISTGTLFSKREPAGDKIVGYYAHPSQLELSLPVVLSDLPTFVLSRFYRRGIWRDLDLNLRYANDRDLIIHMALQRPKNTIIPSALYNLRLGGLSNDPAHFSRIAEEHVLIASQLLDRNDLSDNERRTIENWRTRNLVYGFFKSVLRFKWKEAKGFFRQAMEITGWVIVPYAVYLLSKKIIKRIGLRLSGGIDRGVIHE